MEFMMHAGMEGPHDFRVKVITMIRSSRRLSWWCYPIGELAPRAYAGRRRGLSERSGVLSREEAVRLLQPLNDLDPLRAGALALAARQAAVGALVFAHPLLIDDPRAVEGVVHERLVVDREDARDGDAVGAGLAIAAVVQGMAQSFRTPA